MEHQQSETDGYVKEWNIKKACNSWCYKALI